MPNVNMDLLEIGMNYTSIDLAELWGYQDFHPLARGIVTPAGLNIIILFVTHKKEADRIQYVDRLVGDTLFMEGQLKHGTDQRIADNLRFKKDVFHLFYRDNKFVPYTYYGKCSLISARLHHNEPSEFEFIIDKD